MVEKHLPQERKKFLKKQLNVQPKEVVLWEGSCTYSWVAITVGVHPLLEMGTMCMLDHEINTPSLQETPLLNMTCVQIYTLKIPSDTYTSDK